MPSMSTLATISSGSCGDLRLDIAIEPPGWDIAGTAITTSVGSKRIGADPEPGEPLEAVAVGSRHMVLLTGLGAQHVVTVGLRLDRVDEGDVDQYGAMDANETVGPQLLGDPRDGLAQQVGAGLLLQQN